jgi:RNA polymerase-binding transcription factor DksA
MKTEYFKEKLEEDKINLESRMGSVGRKNSAVPGDWEPSPLDPSIESNPIDQADVITNQENDVAVLADLEARYDAILGALSRIDKNTYGKCEVCGEEIEEARLEADPSATTCTKHL